MCSNRKEFVSERVGEDGSGARIMLFAKPVGKGHREGVEVFVGNGDWAATWRQREERVKIRRVCSFKFWKAMVENLGAE